MRLYHCETIPQFKIGQWLEEQGVKKDDIEAAVLVSPTRVKLINPAGAYLIVDWLGDRAEINQDKEA